MSAGLPGVGLSGVFFILSALLMVPLEIRRTIRGQSSVARWVTVLRNLAIALAMIVCVELAYAVMRLAVGLFVPHGGDGGDRSRTANAFHMLPVAPSLATVGIIAFLLLAAKLAQLLSRSRRSRVVRKAAEAAAPQEEEGAFTTLEVPSTLPEGPSARTAT